MNRKAITTITSGLLALSIMSGIAGQVFAATADEISPNNTKPFYDQLDRESEVDWQEGFGDGTFASAKKGAI